jgi:hypothetical protein
MTEKIQAATADFSGRSPGHDKDAPNAKPHRDAAVPVLGYSFVRLAKCLAFALVVVTGISTATSGAAASDGNSRDWLKPN